MKRLLIVCLLLLCLIPVSGWAEQTAEVPPEPLICGDYDYVLLEDGTAEIVKYNGSDKEAAVPAELDGIPVTAIGSGAFSRVGLTTLTLPHGIRSIGDRAFFYNDIMSVVLPDGLETIGEDAFWGCKITAVTLPESLVSIGDGAFMGNSLKEIALPGNLAELGGADCFGRTIGKITVSSDNPCWQVIDGMLFRREDACLFLCPAELVLTECEIPEGTAIIGEGAFAGNRTLTSVIVPEGVTVIGERAFGSCRNLERVSLPVSLREIGSSAFYACGNLMSLSLPEGLTRLGNSAFYGCSRMTEISIPASLTEVGTNPFRDCSRLDLITIAEGNPVLRFEHGMLFDLDKGVLICCVPKGVDSDCIIPDGISVIDEYAFFQAGIETLVLSDGVTEIRESAFGENYGLMEVRWSESLRSIGEFSFGACGLSSLRLPEGLIIIGTYAFWGNEDLKTVYLPSTVREMAGTSFYGCDSLTRITVSPDNPHLEVINGAIIDKTDKRLICVPEAFRGGRYEIPTGVEIIGYEAFIETNPPCEIMVPEGVTTLEKRSFVYCTDVDIFLPASLIEIDPGAFYDQGAGGPNLHVVPGSDAEAFCKEAGLKYTLDSQ